MDTEVLVTKLQAAKAAITQAEENVEKAISEIHAAPRAKKVTISEALESAFTRLHAAKAELAQLETLIAQADK